MEKMFYISPDADKLFSALCSAQGEFPVIKKTDQAHRHKYANINSVLEAIRPVLSKYGLSIQQHPSSDASGHTILVTILCHTSGQYSMSSVRIVYDETDIQSLGSGITYMRRYAIVSILGLEQEDDDGNYTKDKKEAVKEYVVPITKDELASLENKIKEHVDPQSVREAIKRHTNVSDLSKLTGKQYTWLMHKILS